MRSLALLVVFVLSACGGSPPRVPAPDALHRTWVEAPADARLASWHLVRRARGACNGSYLRIEL